MAEVFPKSFEPFILAVAKGELRHEAFPDGLWKRVPMQSEPLAQGRRAVMQRGGRAMDRIAERRADKLGP